MGVRHILAGDELEEHGLEEDKPKAHGLNMGDLEELSSRRMV